MAATDIKEKLTEVWNEFYNKEKTLFENNSNERSVSHKFAEYLQKEYEGEYNVDCEYSRVGIEKDIIKRFGFPFDMTTADLEAKTVFPDIIVHNRGKNLKGDNFLIIEIKKKGSSKANIIHDYRKLIAFSKGEFIDREGNIVEVNPYEYACFIIFHNAGEFKLEVYANANDIITKINEMNS